MSGIEGVGEAVTGGMFARTAEPEAGEATHEAEGNCLNCGAELDGAYCRRCGQRGHVHRTISAIGHDLIHGILHLDGKLWRTLPLLAWRPGELTRRYVHGERAKFVSPLGMFLFAIFLMFAVLQVYGLSLSSLELGPVGASRNLEMATRSIDAELARAEEDRREEAAETGPRVQQRIARLDQRIAQLRQNRETIATLQRTVPGLAPVDDGFHTGWARLDYGIKKINENPSLALYKLQANGYKFSWLLIPISVPFVWLLFFWTRRFRFYDHTVFVTYSLAFMSLLAIVLTILGFAGAPAAITGTAATFIPPIHMYRQLKQAYGLGWFSALVRTFLLVIFCFVTASLFFVLLLGIGALG